MSTYNAANPSNLILFVLPLVSLSQFPLGGINCYMGAFYSYNENSRNFEVRTCSLATKYCGVILHNKAENDMPGIVMRLTCEQAAMHCKRSGIVDTALFVLRYCSENLCNFK